MKTTKTFNKVVVSKNGTPDVLEIKKESIVAEKKNGLLIEVWAFGIGWADVMAQRGGYALAPKKPFTPGYDFVGRVIESYDSTHFEAGDRVAALLPRMGTYSEILEVDEKYLVKIPATVDIEKVAAAILNYTTAYCIIGQKAKVTTGDSVYIQGVSGGVGLALAQIGQSTGLKMYGTTSASKTPLVAGYGVNAIDYETERMEKVILQEHPHGIDAAFDARGGNSLSNCLKVVKKGGVVVSYGFAGDNYGGNREMLRGLGIAFKNFCTPTGKSIKFCATPSEVEKKNAWYKETLRKIFEQIDSGEISPLIGDIVPFQEITKAHKRMESGKLAGKIIVKTKYFTA